MKKLFFLVFIFLSIKSLSQTYRVNFQMAQTGCSGACFLNQSLVSIVLLDVNDNVIPYTGNITNLGNNINIGSFETSIKPYKITQKSICNFGRADGQYHEDNASCPKSTYNLTYEIIFDGINNCDYKTSPFPQNSSILNYHLRANLQTIEINNTSCVSAQLSCSGNIQRWEVKKYGSDIYEIIPNSNINTLNKSYNEIYSDNSGINQTTYFRAKFTGTEIYTYHPFVFIPCPPILNSTSDKNYTSCSDRKDGEVTFTFNRPLYDNETYLFTRNPVGAPTAITSAYSSNITEIEKLSPLEYKWKNIAPGIYNFKYQTIIGTNNPSPSSDVSGQDFTITPKPELTFAAPPTQPLCSTDKGSITITAQGGTSPYFYILDNEKEIINSESVPKKHQFISPFKLTELSAGDHNIKVVDTNGCIEIKK
jgi:hypothetical protein